MSFSMNKGSRKMCWDARDQFWKCLDQHGQESENTTCQRYKDAFYENCPKKWIEHFTQIYSKKAYTENIKKYGDPIAKLKDVPK